MKAVNLHISPNQVMNTTTISLYLFMHIRDVFDIQVIYLERGNGGAVITVLSEDWPYVAAQILQDSALYALKEENEKALRALAAGAPTDVRGYRLSLPTASSYHLP